MIKKQTIEDVRRLKGLPLGVLETKFGEVSSAIAASYLHNLIVRTEVKIFKEKKDYPIVNELYFIQDQMDRMEILIMKLKKDNESLKLKLKYLTED